MKESFFSVSVIIPTRNSSTTILDTLESLFRQRYPIKEIIIVDNVSKDNTHELIDKFSKKHKKINIKFVINKQNVGVGGSYNKGVKMAKSEYVVFMHSDSSLPTVKELERLTYPIRKNSDIVATYSFVLHPEKIWRKYNFWLKYLLARGVGKEVPGLNDKFDCVNKSVFNKIGGFNTKHYGQHIGIGADDADLHIRLKKKGLVVLSKARVIHLHFQGDNYTFKDLEINRKLLARSYGRLIRLHWRELDVGALSFAVKPLLVLILVTPFLIPYNIYLLIAFSIWYMYRMYITPSVIKDPKIFLLPFITIYFIFYETFWMTESFFIRNK